MKVPFFSRGSAIILSSLLLLMLLAACSAVPASKYYSLKESSSAPSGSSPANPNLQKSPALAIGVQYVNVPVQVDRPQIVLTDPDTTQVTLLNNSQWVAPLADEIRLALANELVTRLNAVDLSLVSGDIALPAWFVDVDVLQFDSFYEKQIRLAASWRIQSRGRTDNSAFICQAEVRLPVSGGIDAVVAGHRQAVRQIGWLIAAHLQQKPEPVLSGTTYKGCVNLGPE